MRNIVLLALALFFYTSEIFSQQTITGKVLNDVGEALPGATISLIHSADSSVRKYATSNKSGSFTFQSIDSGFYRVIVNSVGFESNQSDIFYYKKANLVLPDFQLQRKPTTLKGVEVSATRPLIQVRADKTILNVEGTINAIGSDALELLRKAPGVMLDRDDNISLAGKNGVQVYIDGKPSPLAGKDLADYLKNLQSAQIESFEIITNPSAKYEAAGNAGIINIRLKKNKQFGTNGSANLGYNIGRYPKYNAGLNLNSRTGRTNVFGTFNFSHNKNFSEMYFDRTVGDSSFNQRTDLITRNTAFNYKVGADFFASRFHTLGVVANGSFGSSDIINTSTTPIVYTPLDKLVKYLVADNDNDVSRDNHNLNLNYRFADTSNHELTVDFDYGFFDHHSDQWQPNVYYDSTGQNELQRLVYNMVGPTTINLYSFRADYEQNFLKGKLGLGTKVSYANTDNDFQRYNVYNSNKVLDTLRSNSFLYRENINALYVNYNRAFKGVMIQAGLRMEHTISKGHSGGYRLNGSNYVEYDSVFRRPYTDFFPSFAVTFNKNPLSTFNLTYSRRIDRPAYQDLNPFEIKLDEYTFQKGNTNLRPQYTNSFGLSHTYKFKLTTALNYSYVQDIFAQLVDTADVTKSFISKRNLATQNIVSLNISYPFSYKKYSAFINFNGHYSHYKGNFGAGRNIDLDVIAASFYAQQSLKLSNTFSVEMSGWYTTPSIWQGTFKSKQMGSMDLGFQKVIFKGKGNFKLSVSDVLGTMRWAGSSNFAGQDMRARGQFDSRQLRLNLNYRFGNTQVKASRLRKSALEEEAKRAQSQGTGIGTQ